MINKCDQGRNVNSIGSGEIHLSHEIKKKGNHLIFRITNGPWVYFIAFWLGHPRPGTLAQWNGLALKQKRGIRPSYIQYASIWLNGTLTYGYVIHTQNWATCTKCIHRMFMYTRQELCARLSLSVDSLCSYIYSHTFPCIHMIQHHVYLP